MIFVLLLMGFRWMLFREFSLEIVQFCKMQMSFINIENVYLHAIQKILVNSYSVKVSKYCHIAPVYSMLSDKPL